MDVPFDSQVVFFPFQQDDRKKVIVMLVGLVRRRKTTGSGFVFVVSCHGRLKL